MDCNNLAFKYLYWKKHITCDIMQKCIGFNYIDLILDLEQERTYD